MTTSGQFGQRKLSRTISVVLSGISISLSLEKSMAQITPDHTLGSESSVVAPDNIDGIESERISGGAVRGSNLFHSFQEFNIDEGKGAYFDNPAAIQNIFSRVTGSNPSEIMGRLGVLGNANLFFLNPNGILFGENASLDIRGSFLATTADSILFPDGNKFSALNPEAAPLLTVNVQQPIGLELQGREGIITNRGILVAEENLTLSAGNLDLQGQLLAGNDLNLQATNTVKIRDSVTQPFIAAAGNQLLVQGNQTIDIFALNHSNSGLLSGGDMVLQSANAVSGDAHYWSGGSFRIEQLDGSLGELVSLYDPIILSVGDVSFTNYFGTSLHILAGGSVNIPGTIIITGADTGTEGIDFIAEEITLSDETTIVSVDGRARPTLDVRAGVDPDELGGSSVIPDNDFPNEFFFSDSILSDLWFGFPLPTETTSPTSADINIGTIIFADVTISDLVFGGVSQNDLSNRLLTGQVLLTNKYKPNESLDGDIEISATIGNLLPFPLGFLLSDIDNIAILTGSTAGGGSVYVDSRGSTTLNGIVGSVAIPDFDNTFTGNGGEIKFLANHDLTLNPGSAIISIGALGGEITLKGNGSLSLSDSLVANLTAGGSEGEKGGSLLVDGFDTVELLNGEDVISDELLDVLNPFGIGSIIGENFFNIFVGSNDPGLGTVLFTATIGTGNAGDATINTSNRGELQLISDPEAQGSVGIGSTTSSEGNSGNLIVNTGQLTLNNQSPLKTPNGEDNDLNVGLTTLTLPRSSGNGGNLTVHASESITIIGNEPDQFLLNPENLNLVRELIEISTGMTSATQGSGEAGDLEINTGDLTMRDGVGISSGTTARENSGNGGRLEIDAGGSINLQGKAIISNTTVRSGNTEELVINAEGITLKDGGLIASDTTGAGDAGSLSINTTQLDISGGSRVGASTINQELEGVNIEGGAGAEVFINADSINITGTSDNGEIPSGIFSNSRSNRDPLITEGNAGNVEIHTNNLTIEQGGLITTETSGSGQGGKITLLVTDTLKIAGTSEDGTLLSELSTETSGAREAGDLTIETPTLLIEDGAQISASTLGTGRAGNILVQKADSVQLSNNSVISTTVETEAVVNSATTDIDSQIEIQTQSLSLTNRSKITASTFGVGDAGNIFVWDADSIVVDNSSISTSVATNAQGNGGNIDFRTSSLWLDNNAQISANTSGNGEAGNIIVTANAFTANNGGQLLTNTDTSGNFKAGDITLEVLDNLLLSGSDSGLFAQTEGDGNAGGIEINTSQLTIDRGASISAFTEASGDSGTIKLNASQSVLLTDNSKLTVETSAAGQPGDIFITTPTLIIGKDAEISARATAASTNTEGGGSITINSSNLDLTGKLGIFAETQGLSPAGTLTIQPDNNKPELDIRFTDTAIISSSTTGNGAGGDINLTAPETINISGQGEITVETSDSGNAGTISIKTKDLNISNQTKISASTSGTGSAGSIIVLGNNSVVLDKSLISTTIDANAIVNPAAEPSNIKISTSSLSLINDAQVTASTSGMGDAGNVNLEATETLSLNNSIVSSAVETGGVGKGGNVQLNAPSISLTENSEISTATNGEGNAGTLTVTANEIISMSSSNASSAIQSEGKGTAGIVTIKAPQISLSNGSEISSSTAGEGDANSVIVEANNLEIASEGKLRTSTNTSFEAGDIILNVKDNITLSGANSGLFANTEEDSTGEGGNILIREQTAQTLTVKDGAEIAVDSQGSGEGGDINIKVDLLTLDKGKITAETTSNQGGNITLTIFDRLRLRNESQITATAGTEEAGGDGGNIEINAPFILAVPQENSDITANAFRGDGGNVTLNSPIILGIEFREEETALSDITASSEFGQPGEVEINTSGVDPTRGLNNLPQEATETEVAQSCQTSNGQTTLEFFDVGRGGLPPTPEDLLSSEVIIAEWIPLDLETELELPSDLTKEDMGNVTLLSSFLCRE